MKQRILILDFVNVVGFCDYSVMFERFGRRSDKVTLVVLGKAETVARTPGRNGTP